MCRLIVLFYSLDSVSIVWGEVGGYETCMTSWCMREHCMFLTVEILPLFSVSRMCC